MSHTAPTKEQLAQANITYLAALQRFHKDLRIGRYSLEQEEIVAWARNNVVALQLKLPKGGEVTHAN